MTEIEAIKRLDRNAYRTTCYGNRVVEHEENLIAIQALEEVQRNRKHGRVPCGERKADISCENFDKYAREVAICENENTFSAGLIRAVEIIRECESDGNG